MTDIATRPPDPEPRGWGDIARHNAGKDNPMLLVPADLRQSLAVVWMANAHLIPDALALCATVRVYTSEHNITPDVFTMICRKLMQPHRREKHKFASDLMADFSGLVAQAVRDQKAADATRERRETFAEPPAEGLPKLNDLFQTP